MSSPSERIATKNLELETRKLSLQARRQQLREDALRYCRRPATLGIAAASGFVLARLLPPLLRSRHPQKPKQPFHLLEPYLQMIPVLVFEYLRQTLVRPARNTRQNAENNTDSRDSH